MALVGTANMSSSAGALGYYLETIAQQGLVGLVLAQSPQLRDAPSDAGLTPLDYAALGGSPARMRPTTSAWPGPYCGIASIQRTTRDSTGWT